MAEVYGDPNRQFGIPGIDDQEPGSAAQQAAVDAWKGAYDEGGVDTDAARAAAQRAAQSAAAQYGGYDWNNGRAPNIFNPREAYQAWLRGGAVDYNRMVFEGRPGFQSSNPAIYYGMNEQARAPFGPTYWQGTSLNSTQQAQVNAARAPLAPVTMQAMSVPLPSAPPRGEPVGSLPQMPAPTAPPRQMPRPTMPQTPSTPGGLVAFAASDGQTFEGQSPDVQAAFRAAYGENASSAWEAEHNAAISQGVPAAPRVNPATGEVTAPMTDPEYAEYKKYWDDIAAKQREQIALDNEMKRRGMDLAEAESAWQQEYQKAMLEFNNQELAARQAMEAARLNIQQQQLRIQMRQRRAPRYAGVRSVY
jgi:hypothetical protein